MKKKHEPRDYLLLLKRLRKGGVSGGVPPNHPPTMSMDLLPSVEDRVKMVFGLVNNKERRHSNMLFFVMYDIESDKVRRYVVKYLERMGCIRVQKSIFLADLEPSKYNSIRGDLAAVQAAYDNHDSILVVPVSTEQLRAMKIIGQKIDIDIIMHTKNTLFF